MADTDGYLCRRLAEDTLESIRDLRGKVSVRVSQLLRVIEERLFDSDFDVRNLLRECGLRDPNFLTLFATEVGLTPKAYILENQMELAGRILAGTDLQIWRVGVEVGFEKPGSFGRAFKKWSGKTPGAFRKAARSEAPEEPPPLLDELISRQEIRQAVTGDLDSDRAEALAERLYGLGDLVCSGYRELNPPTGGSRLVESTMAHNLWKWIENLPYEVQMQAIESQGPRYETLVLFNRLCTVSVEAEDGFRAYKLATLAMASLHALGDRVGEHYLSVFARAYSILGFAQRRYGEFDQAVENFNLAMEMLKMAGEDAHPIVLSELYFFRATVEAERDNPEEAERLADQGKGLLEETMNAVLGAEWEADFGFA